MKAASFSAFSQAFHVGWGRHRAIHNAAARPWLTGLLLLSVSLSPVESVWTADEELAQALRKLDARVFPAEDRETIAHQVRDELRAWMRQANDRSTAEWRQLTSFADWQRYRDEKISALKKSLGSWPAPPNPLPVRVAKTVEGDGFAIDNLLFESRPGWWVTANLYRPATPRDSMPGLLICHAHHTPKEHGELQDMGMTWARAGCCVLVMDQVGHGERRQHPFGKASDFEQPFRVGHADYYFRYDSALQLSLVGESLIGWMVWDLMRGVDLLLTRPGIDPQRLILLGAVAGGGDPAAVTGALDERLAAVVPFNFGGPQPETRFPLPDDAETTFNYAGGGSWESTRNLRDSAAHGFLPWVIVGGIAPRRLIYAHEFQWDQERDPVWKRLQTIYQWAGHPTFLDFTKGSGAVTGSSATDTHCTHIGQVHRRRIHEAFRAWFGIDVSTDTEFRSRVPSDQLRCWTPELKQELQPRTLAQMTTALADELRQRRLLDLTASHVPGGLRGALRKRWSELLGVVSEDPLVSEYETRRESVGDVMTTALVLGNSSGHKTPVLLLQPKHRSETNPVVVAFSSQGKERLLKERSAEIATLLERGSPVCLVDPRGLGESTLGDRHGRRSSATSYSSTALMLGTPLLGLQLRDVRTTLAWLRQQPQLKGRAFAVWGESFTPPNPETSNFRQPRDDDDTLPAPSEPQAPLLAILTGLFEEDIAAIYSVGGLKDWRSLLTDHLVLTAYDSIVPGALTAGDIPELIAAQRRETKVLAAAEVDGWNRLVPSTAKRSHPVALLTGSQP
jgi:cephalosporin-C deacetylase-like acetyl esterase